MKAMKLMKSLLIGFVLVLMLGGCETFETASSPRTIILNGTSYSEDEYGPFESWVGKDYYDGWKVRVEVGVFDKPEFSNYGFILYDGTNEGDLTMYERRGVNKRWNWGENDDNFSFVIKPDGKGLFYDFSTADEDGMAKADEVYKCHKR